MEHANPEHAESPEHGPKPEYRRITRPERPRKTPRYSAEQLTCRQDEFGHRRYFAPEGKAVCGRLKRTANRRVPNEACTNPPMTNGGCRMHGGPSPGGKLKAGGRYSRVLGAWHPAFERALQDKELLDVRRDLALMDGMIDQLLERIAAGDAPRCWVPGCATGEEAYSLAILFAEVIERRQLERELIIFASDVDERALAVAREGVYPRAIDADVSDERLQRWFQLLDDHVRVASEIRDKVVFASHSLQRDPPFSRLNLISCRNLLIYLDRELQEQVMAIFHYASREDAYLFLGGSETASGDLFRPLSKQHRIYQVRESTSGRKSTLLDLPLVSQHGPKPVMATCPPAGSLGMEAHRAALEEAAPPSILVDEQWNIAHLSETAGRFLQPRGGAASFSVTDCVRLELRDSVTRVLAHVFREGEQDLSPFVGVRFNGTSRRVAVLAHPRRLRADGPMQVLLMFLEGGLVDGLPDIVVEPQAEGEHERSILERLQRAEVEAARAGSEHRAAEEDLRAANEELQSLNEEYRSTTEELETSKEELQSINEELQTVNFELKTKLEEISRAHNDLENLMAATDIGTLFLDRNLCIQRFTPRLADVFNVKSHDRGRPIADLTHNLLYDDLDRDARRVLADLVPIERDAITREGDAFVVRLRPYRTAQDRIEGVIITLVDVTRLKRAELVLRESEERFRALVDASAQTVWTRDVEGLAVEDSPSWRAYTGQIYEQWKGHGWLDAVHPEDRDNAVASWRHAVETAQPLVNEIRLYHASSGEHRWTSLRAVPLRDEQDGVRGWVGMNIDIHDRALAEAALRDADARKDEFLTMVGHELRNPLAAIRSSVAVATLETAQVGAPLTPERLHRILAIIDRQSRHMTRLVNDLLDITRITRGKLELQRTAVDLEACVREIVDALRPALASAGLELDLDLSRQPLHLDADPERLMQIVDNLLRNAIHCTERGGRIEITTRKEEGRARIAVRDTGIGFEPEHAEALFELFHQEGTARKRGGLGLGLGLALVKRLTEMHGGTITARSDGPGKGSDFELRWPLADAASAQDFERGTMRPTPKRRPRRRRILIVDDEVDVADSFAALLTSLEQDVHVAYGGEEALELAEKHRPELAFLDLAMPGMNGKELAQRLRARFPATDLVLVSLSGHGTRAETEPSRNFACHWLKPVDVETALELLHALPVSEGVQHS